MKSYAASVVVAGPLTLRGRCACGWTGPQRVWAREASVDIEHHLDEDDHADA